MPYCDWTNATRIVINDTTITNGIAKTATGATIPAMTMVPAPRPAFEEALDPAMRSSLPHDDERPRGMDPGTRPDVR